MTDEKQTPNPEQVESTEAEAEQLRQEGETFFDAFVRYQRQGYKHSFKAIEALFPEGFTGNLREASQQFMRSWRVLVQGAGEGIKSAVPNRGEDDEEAEDDDKPSTTGKAKVKVEVS